MTVRTQKNQSNPSLGSDLRIEKEQLRQNFLAQRNSLSSGEVGPLSKTILARFWRLRAAKELAERVRTGQPAWISCYVNFGREVVTRPLIQKALARGFRVAVPVVSSSPNKQIILSEVDDVPEPENPGPGWVRTRWGLCEPRDLHPVEPGKIDCFVIPGLAFDRRGVRLGFGKGYYDGLLSSARADVWRIGLAFSFQLTDQLPSAKWDVALHRVVTETGVFRCREMNHAMTNGAKTAKSPRR